MATPQEIQKQLERIAKLYEQLGEKNPFDKMDPAKIAASTDEVKKLEIAILGATTAVTAMNAEVEDIRSAFMATVGELKKTTVGLNMSTRVFRDFGSIAQQIKYDQEGIVDLTEKDVKALREKFNVTLSNLEASKGQLEADKQNLLDRQAAGENVNKEL